MKTKTQHYLPGTVLDSINKMSKDEILALLMQVPEIGDTSPLELHTRFEQLHFLLLTGEPLELEHLKPVFTAYYGLLKIMKQLTIT